PHPWPMGISKKASNPAAKIRRPNPLWDRDAESDGAGGVADLVMFASMRVVLQSGMVPVQSETNPPRQKTEIL
ncbi:MAG: hypothetical protein WCO91_01115, partial [Gemmataceae bacterium]